MKNIFSVVDKLEIEENIGCDDIEDEDCKCKKVDHQVVSTIDSVTNLQEQS